MAKSKRRVRLPRKTASPKTDDGEPPTPQRPQAPAARATGGSTRAVALDLPGQSPPIDRGYLRLVVGRRARPPRTAGLPPLPEAYLTRTGNYLLQLTAFHVGDAGG